ncbi:FAD-dependent oxidoreductase [Pseudazoarcus pumilus]|uniref:Amine oxidase domain-containing protein n=1 Tax=Pseudazoarcus pumilus TaxID=2067960 RepID=A0A2I6S3Q9_9RHOO|nr:FAD-dependent oxidoreductase [Pseudazoarcus pumilus]AUN93901.1 hypothetical protein C0099_02440 [Pseudazoarcus pumilus]
MTTAVVAGGGIAGLLAAKLLKNHYERVLVIERDSVCGGLLGSIVNNDGVSFDHGAHVLSETGLAELDALLYGGLSSSHWREFNILRAGNWVGGAMNRSSPFPDARRLGVETLRRGLSELAQAAFQRNSRPPAHLGEALERRFGATLATEVAGATVRKQLGVALEDLHPDTPFATRRVVCADAEQSRLLKLDPRFTEACAFASYEEGASTLLHRYPRQGGLAQWIEGFVAGLQDDGVEILCGRTIAAIAHGNGEVRSVTLDDDRTIDCELLAWTLPSAMLLRAGKIAFTGKAPLSRPIGLFHLVFDLPFCDPNYHITCYDESFRTFRITLYPNLRSEQQQAPYNCTVEVIGDAQTEFAALLPQVVEELRVMGVVDSDARLASSLVQTVPMGFPATTHEFMAGNAAQATLARQHMGNSLLLGRARCPPFFAQDVLVDTYRTITSLAP